MTRPGYERPTRAHRGYDADLHERPLVDLCRELLQEAQGLFREEVRLARAEARDEALRVGKGGAAAGVGGAVLYAALLLFGATLVLLGATFLPAWVAGLIVTVIYAVAGWLTLNHGREQLRRTRRLETIEHVKEDARWARETMRDVRYSRSANA